MRTTLTLDPDVAQRVERLQAERGATLKEIVNQGLRAGLTVLERPPRRKHFKTTEVSLKPRGMNMDDIAEALVIAEGDSYR